MIINSGLLFWAALYIAIMRRALVALIKDSIL